MTNIPPFAPPAARCALTMELSMNTLSFSRQDFENPKPDATLTPADSAVVDRRVRALTLWQVLPGRSSSKNVKEAVQGCLVAPAGRTTSFCGKQRPNHNPHFFIHVKSCHVQRAFRAVETKP